MTLLNLIEQIQNISISHNLVKTFKTGESYDIAITGQDDLLIIYLEAPFTFTQLPANKERISFALLCLDSVPDGSNTEWLKVSNCKTILEQIISKLRQEVKGVQEDYNIITVTEFSDDNLSGVRAEINIIQPKESVESCTPDGTFL